MSTNQHADDRRLRLLIRAMVIILGASVILSLLPGISVEIKLAVLFIVQCVALGLSSLALLRIAQ